jgi:hypothetical protein
MNNKPVLVKSCAGPGIFAWIIWFHERKLLALISRALSVHLPIAQLQGFSVRVVGVFLLLPLVAKAKDAQTFLAGHKSAKRLPKAENFGVALCVCVIALRLPIILDQEKQ